MHECLCRFGSVAGGAVTHCAGMPLQADEFDGIVGLAAGSLGVGAIVAALAVNPSMTHGLLVQSALRAVAIAVASSATACRLVKPWFSVLCHHCDIAMAVNAT